MIEKIKDQIKIINIIKFLNITINKKGNRYWCICPLPNHKEKTESFLIDKERFYCFGCKKFGDIFNFYQEYYSINFSIAIQKIIDDFKLKIKYEGKKYQKETEILFKSSEYYKSFLHFNNVQEYLNKRFISKESQKKFNLGYANHSSLIEYLQGQKYTINDLKNIGVTTFGSLDFLRNRLIFPLKNRFGDIVAFAGRSLNNNIKPKYLHYKNTILFEKSLFLYGENLINSKYNYIILVEGYIDVINLYSIGFFNIVCTMGTTISTDHIKKMFNYVNIIYICFDQDNAGQNAIWNNKDILLSSLKDMKSIYICKWKNFKDLDEIIQYHRRNKKLDQEIFNIIKKIIDDAEFILDWIDKKIYYISQEKIKAYPQKDHKRLININIKQERKKILTLLNDQSIIDYYQDQYFTYKNINSQTNYEYVLMSILLKKPYIIEKFEEEIMNISFKDKDLEVLREVIVHNLISKNNINEIIESLKYNFHSLFFKLKNISEPLYIMNNTAFLEDFIYGLIQSIHKV